MPSRNMQVIGLCRFSYPALGGFQVEHDTTAARIDYLFDPARLEERFRTFQAFTLPCIAAQTDPDFTFLVVIGNQMPKLYRDRLMDLLSAVPQAVVQEHAPGPHRQVMQAALNSVRRDTLAPCLQFRLDDDDAVSVQYVEELRNAARQLDTLVSTNRHIAIDFNNGWIAKPSSAGLSVVNTVQSFWTPALAISVQPGTGKSIMNFGHSKLAHHMPAVTLPNEHMFIRGHNDFNDSRQNKRRTKQFNLAPITQDQADLLKLGFNVDTDQVRALYA